MGDDTEYWNEQQATEENLSSYHSNSKELCYLINDFLEVIWEWSPGRREFNWLSNLYKTYNIGTDYFYAKYTSDKNGYIDEKYFEKVSDIKLANIEVLILYSNDLIKLKEIIKINSKCANNLRDICFLEMVESIVETMEANINEKEFIFRMQI